MQNDQLQLEVKDNAFELMLLDWMKTDLQVVKLIR